MGLFMALLAIERITKLGRLGEDLVAERLKDQGYWRAPGSEDTELRVLMEPEAGQWRGWETWLIAIVIQWKIFGGGETISDAKVVIVMSRNTILMKGGAVYVVPTADISQFRKIGKQQRITE